MENNTAIIQALQQKFGSADWSKWSMHRWPYWDYARLTVAGINAMSFFVNPRGSTDPVSGLQKTKEQTNMEKSRTFGQVYYVITRISTHIHVLPLNRQAAGIIADDDCLYSADGMVLIAPELRQLEGMGVLEMEILSKKYAEINQPFLNCPPCMGVEIKQHAAFGLTESAWYQQSNVCQDAKGFTPPQLIEPDQTFDLRINFPNGNTPAIPQVESANVAIDIGMILDGYILRPAQ